MSVRIKPPHCTAPFSSRNSSYRPEKALPSLRLALHDLAATPQEPPPQQVSGLRTPPVDNMATTYHHMGGNAYEKHGMPNGHSSLATHAHMATVPDPRTGSCYRYPTPITAQPSAALAVQPVVQPAAQHQFQPQPPVLASNTDSQRHAYSSRTASQPASPVFRDPSQLEDKKVGETETLIHHSLQIPKCISPRGGSISEFATRMTCLFWFETADELQKAKKIKSQPTSSVPPLPGLAKPHDSFSKWTHGVLSTTQVTQNVILLALQFIYRLKLSTPRIKGRAGSEYRLLTVALMLSNKFLDDNTYTNKTWAEVSGFAVTEIHVMEVEFLNNLRYNLLVSAKEWDEWLEDLACFHEYYERALVLPQTQPPPTLLPSPTNGSFYSPQHRAVTPGMPFTDTSLTPVSVNRLSPKTTLQPSGSSFLHNSTSPAGLRNDVEYLAPPRKRSLEQDMCEQHIAKRPAPNRPPPSEHTKMSVPQLSIITTNPITSQAQVVPDMISLPPLQPGMRAMSTVYPQQQQQPVMVNVPQPAISTPTSLNAPASMAYPVSSLPSQPASIGYRTPSKHHSPTSLTPAYASSPLGELVPNSAVNTPMGQTPFFNSPMTYLEQRHSPYRPIRHVHHLGQATSLDHYHLAVPVQPAQMHYQALGRRDDVRSGVVPEFLLYNRQPVVQQPTQLPTPGYPQGAYNG